MTLPPNKRGCGEITTDGSRQTLLINQKVKAKSLSHVQLFAAPWTVAHQAPPSMGFSGQEHWSGLPFPSPGDLPDPGIEPRSPALQADALTSEPPGKPLQQGAVDKMVDLWNSFVETLTLNVPAFG